MNEMTKLMNNHEIPKKLKCSIEQLNTCLSEIEDRMELFSEGKFQAALASVNDSSVGKARLYHSLATGLVSLVYVCVCLKGEDPDDYNLRNEIERLKLYEKKLDDARPATTEDNRKKLNVAAANRFIRHALTFENGGGGDSAVSKRSSMMNLDKKPNKVAISNENDDSQGDNSNDDDSHSSRILALLERNSKRKRVKLAKPVS